jgi:hypothetical protein
MTQILGDVVRKAAAETRPGRTRLAGSASRAMDRDWPARPGLKPRGYATAARQRAFSGTTAS